PPFYLMSLAESSLADDLDNDRSLNGDFIACFSDIVAGLEELHSMQIYHRDLKPQNVLKFADQSRPFYSISDFGLISLKESRLSALTKTGMRKSSDYYTAPEIAKDMRLASVYSDIYSLGCILHDMVGTEDRVPCNEIREPGDFSAILLGCTRRDPSQRFKSVRSVLDAILSVDFTAPAPTSAESVNFIETLAGSQPLEPEFWHRLADFLEHEADTADRAAICGKLSNDRIQALCAAAPGPANRISIAFSNWITESAFSFDLCDALANRLEEFFRSTDFEAKVECLMAMLELGTSHNRWFVERKFVSLCGPGMDENLAKRLSVQFRIGGADVCRMIEHIESSVGVSRNMLHPALVKTLGDVC
ncbi:protein kinase, partial [Mesorhizobium sp.]|uniref:protein kinase domain-containing protein n=1 Tax=Mesorhizobium sp. TaxID=1871066 RepID=UPI0025797176